MSAPRPGSPADPEGPLRAGPLDVLGQIIGSSNETFLVRLGPPGRQEAADGAASSFADVVPRDAVHAVYKPQLGERPLGDFPPGLHRRERAAYLVSRHLGWGLVPPTIIREDGPFGVGSYQLFEHHDARENYFSLYARAVRRHRGREPLPVVLEGFGDPRSLALLLAAEDRRRDEDDDVDLADPAAVDPPLRIAADPAVMRETLRRLAVFDVLANNADRKAGHVLRGEDGALWGIDHGLCFAADPKLRTVIWDFAGEELRGDEVEDLWRLIDEVPVELAELLEPGEVRALRGRARRLAASGVLPADPSGMRFPWPLV